MKIIVRPSLLKGEVCANPSKSHMQRIVAMSAWYGQEMTIINPCLSNDCLAALNVCKRLGSDVSILNDEVLIKPNSGILDVNWMVGESGLSARIFAVLAALSEHEIRLEAKGTLLQRPLTSLLGVLEQLGARVISDNPYLPFIIQPNPTIKKELVLDGSTGSQVLTALLIGLPRMPYDTVIRVRNLKSRPYVDLTISLLSEFGIEIKEDSTECFFVKGGQSIKKKTYINEGDWSGASLLAASVSEGSSLKLMGLKTNSQQGDKAILDILVSAGAKLELNNDGVVIKADRLNAFSYDATHTPDLFPPLVALAMACEGVSKIKGTARLIHKESNRLESLILEFSKLGLELRQSNDDILIKGGKISGGIVQSHNDHRIAMALAIAATKSTDEVIIESFECVNKSYPEFLEHFRSLGGNYEILEE